MRPGWYAKFSIGWVIDSYTEGLIEKDEFEPCVTRLRQRMAHIEEQCEALADEELLQREMHLIVSRLDDFAAQMERNLDDLEWAKKREIIRALVRRVEVGLEQVQVVFRVDSFPGESDPEKKSLQLCRGSMMRIFGPTKKKVVMVVDRSGIHRARKLASTLDHYKGKFELHFLPAHSGHHLNPIEGFWRRMKEVIGAGRCFEDLQQLYRRTRQVLMANQERPIYEFAW
jgi:transposase